MTLNINLSSIVTDQVRNAYRVDPLPVYASHDAELATAALIAEENTGRKAFDLTYDAGMELAARFVAWEATIAEGKSRSYRTFVKAHRVDGCNFSAVQRSVLIYRAVREHGTDLVIAYREACDRPCWSGLATFVASATRETTAGDAPDATPSADRIRARADRLAADATTAAELDAIIAAVNARRAELRTVRAAA